tara:strand:+ start:2368 stop:2898 length:531 start_codon:yes stop_codon:yes gene_type:complete
MSFLRGQKALYPENFRPHCRVLELGSRDINGSPRSVCEGVSEYIGIDFHGGKGVDIAGVAHHVIAERDLKGFDLIVSTEMLEHDPYWEDTIKAAVGALADGGLLLITCASKKRGEHNLEDSPEPGYYRGLDPGEIVAVLNRYGSWEGIVGILDRHDLDTFVVAKAFPPTSDDADGS